MHTKMSGNSIRAAACIALTLLTVGLQSYRPSSAFAQNAPLACMARESLLTQLQEKYGEVPVALGVADGALVELLTAKNGLTWTIILTSPKGMSCLIASGDGWRPLPSAESDPSV